MFELYPAWIFQSTHSITECDSLSWDRRNGCNLFQSTHSITECDKHPATPMTSGAEFQSTHSITECDASESKKSGSAINISIHALHYRVRWEQAPNPLNGLKFQSTHSITECDRKIWCFGPQNPHLAIKKYIKCRTNVLKKDISVLFIGANPLGKTCALRVRTKSQIINGSSRARVCFAPYTSILPW